MSTTVIWNGNSGRRKGEVAEVESASRADSAGPSENICRTVTKVERYHS